MSESYAVLIGNSSFPAEPKLPELRYPERDVDALHEVLTSEEHGIFSHAFVLKNRTSQEIRERINEVLNAAKKDDLVLLYYAGHGKLNRLGRLHLAACDTRLPSLEATAVPINAVREFIDISRSRRIVLILDCCYSGAVSDAFARSTPDDMLQQLTAGRGLHILTASTGVQIAEEREQDGHGLFTKHLVGGIRGGGADLNCDGWVTVDELYQYAHDRVLEEGAQEPTILNLEKTGELIVARSGRKPLEEKKRQVKSELYRLEQEELLTSKIVQRALPLIDRYPDLEGREKEQAELLCQLGQGKIRVGQFVETWTRLEVSTENLTSLAAELLRDSGPVVPARERRKPAAPKADPPAPAPEEEASDEADTHPMPAYHPGAAAGDDPAEAEGGRGPQEAAQPAGGLSRRPATPWVEALGRLARETRSRPLSSVAGLSLLLGVVFLVNLIETAAEGWLGRFVTWGNDLAWASHRLEGNLSFLRHDLASPAVYVGFSAVYFFLFPALCLAVAVALARRREIAAFRVYCLALTADYAISLPFFLLLPVPERWSYPDSAAILLSDLWSSTLIDALRPVSGLDNCFPSFHTSMTVIVVAVCFLYRLRLRWAILALGATVVLSTFTLGIHWLADIAAGIAVGILAVAVAQRLDRRLGLREATPEGAPA